MRQAHRRERGFTLIELMLACGILMVGVAGLCSLQILAAQASQAATDTSTATQLTADYLENARLLAPAALAALPSPQVLAYNRRGVTATAPGFFSLSATRTPAGDFFDLRVLTSWKPRADDPLVRTVAMQTWIPQS